MLANQISLLSSSSGSSSYFGFAKAYFSTHGPIVLPTSSPPQEESSLYNFHNDPSHASSCDLLIKDDNANCACLFTPSYESFHPLALPPAHSSLNLNVSFTLNVFPRSFILFKPPSSALHNAFKVATIIIHVSSTSWKSKIVR